MRPAWAFPRDSGGGAANKFVKLLKFVIRGNHKVSNWFPACTLNQHISCNFEVITFLFLEEISWLLYYSNWDTADAKTLFPLSLCAQFSSHKQRVTADNTRAKLRFSLEHFQKSVSSWILWADWSYFSPWIHSSLRRSRNIHLCPHPAQPSVQDVGRLPRVSKECCPQEHWEESHFPGSNLLRGRRGWSSNHSCPFCNQGI